MNTIQSLFAAAGLHVERIDPRPEAFKMQRRLIGPDCRLIFDVGANVGQTAQEYLRFFPQAQVQSFEPFPDSFRQIPAHPQITANNVAVADSAGTRRFNVCRGSGMNSLLDVGPDGATHMGGSQADLVKTIDVPTITLDEFCAGKFDRIDILKMDAQGSELLVLKGASRLLAAHAFRLIYSEVLFARLYEGQVGFDVLWRHLESFGYRLFGLQNLSMGADLFLGYADAIFVSPEHAATITREQFLAY